ncbi:hypothetical protein CBL_02972 [Carabus blaptoides fortunei]
MLKSIEYLKTMLPIAFSLIEQDDVPVFTFSDWQLMEKVIEILSPFLTVTEEMSAEKYVTSSKIIPITKCLQLQLSKIHSTRYARILQEELLNQVNRRLGKIESNSNLAIATYNAV